MSYLTHGERKGALPVAETRRIARLIALTAFFVALFLTTILFVQAAYGAPQRYTAHTEQALWHRSLDVARQQVGVREATGRNDGPQVRGYLASVGLKEGNPYCQSGIYYCFITSARELGQPTSVIPLPRTGSTKVAWSYVRRTYSLTTLNPQPGDIIWWIVPQGWQGHVEWITTVSDGGWLRTIGFNTSSGAAGSQRDGGGVYIRWRNWLHPLGRMYVAGFLTNTA